MQKKTCQKCFLSIDHLSDCDLILKLYAFDIFYLRYLSYVGQNGRAKERCERTKNMSIIFLQFIDIRILYNNRG